MAVTSTEVEKLIVRMVGDATSYQKMMRDAQKGAIQTGNIVQRQGKRIEAIGRSLQKFARSVKSLGRSLSLKITAPVLGTGAFGVKQFASFNKAMTESTSIMKVNTNQTKQMRDMAMSLRSIKGPEELAQSYFFLASAGMDANQALASLPVIVEFATAGNFDMALATDLLTDAQTALGLQTGNTADDLQHLTNIANALTLANIQANASVQQFAEALTADAANAAQSMGQELESLMAVLGAYASKGKKAAEAGNLYGRATRLLTSAARRNKEEFEKLGIVVVDKVTKEYRDLIEIIEDMEEAFDGMKRPARDAALEKLGFAALAQKSITPLIGMSKQMKIWRQEQAAAGDVIGDVARKQLKAFTNRMRLVWNEVKKVGIQVGEILAPWIIKLGEYVEKVTVFWRKLSPEMKKTVVVIALVAAAVGPLLIGFGVITGWFAVVVIAVGSAITAFGTLIGLLGPAFLPIAAITLFTVALAALALDTGLVSEAVKLFGEMWDDLIDHVQPAIKGIKDALAAGDILLAVKILWTEIQILFAAGIRPLRILWADFVFAFNDQFNSILMKQTGLLANKFLGMPGRLALGMSHREAVLVHQGMKILQDTDLAAFNQAINMADESVSEPTAKLEGLNEEAATKLRLVKATDPVRAKKLFGGAMPGRKGLGFMTPGKGDLEQKEVVPVLKNILEVLEVKRDNAPEIVLEPGNFEF